MQKKNAVLLMLLLMLLSSAAFADGIGVNINGKPLVFQDVKPQLVQNRTLVPLRAIFEALGLTVGWDPQNQVVTGTGSGKTIILKVGERTASVNDAPVTLEVGALIINGRTMVPVRFIAESLGAKVDWEQASKTVQIQYYADEAEGIQAEINSFLIREKTLFAELNAEIAKSNAFKNKALIQIENFKSQYNRLIIEGSAIEARYDAISIGGDTYFGPQNSAGLMHGQGIYYYNNGDFYIGDIVNGKYRGTGVYQWANGTYYIGGFLNNNFNGQGFLNSVDGYYKIGTYVNDLALGDFYYSDFLDDYEFIGIMKDADFVLGRQIESSGAEHISWLSPTYQSKRIDYDIYSNGEFLLYEQADAADYAFTVESYFIDTHLLRYMNLKTGETKGKGVSYIPGEDYVYYGEFFDSYYEKAEGISYYNIKGEFLAFQNEIDRIIAEVITPGMTDLEKEKALHDYIIKLSRYNPDEVEDNIYPSPQHMAYELIFAKEAICEGYAEAMNILLNRVGIPSIIIGGNVGEEGDEANWLGHAWNFVRIDNQYYHLDATWNDPVPDDPNTLVHDYFNMTDAEIAKDHEWEESFDEIAAFKALYPLD